MSLPPVPQATREPVVAERIAATTALLAALGLNKLRVQRLANGESREAFEALRVIERDLLADIGARPLTRRRVKMLQLRYGARIARELAAIRARTLAGLSGLAEHQEAAGRQVLRKVLPAGTQLRRASVRGVIGRFAGRNAGPAMTALSAMFVRRVLGQLRASVGGELDAAVRAMRETFERRTSVLRHTIGSLHHSVSEQAMLRAYTANDRLLLGYYWDSILDGKTSSQCLLRAGKKYDRKFRPVGHSAPWGPGPGSLHPNCRSVAAPRVKGDPYRPPMTADEFLSTLNAAELDEVLGPVRAEMYRKAKYGFGRTKGKIGGDSIEAFLDRDGTYLSLDELRARPGL